MLSLKLFRIFFFVLFLCLLHTRSAFAVKIVAIVNDDIITDIDVDDFEQVLCKLDKNFTCGTQNSRQFALMTLIDSILKLEHFRQMNLLEDKHINRGFYDYKNNVLKSINIEHAKSSKTFDDYLHSEYIWNIMISSQVNENMVKDKDIIDYKKQHNLLNKTDKEIKSLILREKLNNISQSTMAEIKKFYLVEIKGL